jgi:hypothetical protein
MISGVIYNPASNQAIVYKKQGNQSILSATWNKGRDFNALPTCLNIVADTMYFSEKVEEKNT